MSHLVSYKQIEGNLRRTAENGLISLLNHQQLEDLAFNYFGIKDEYGNIIGYQCPYSGKIYTDYKDIVLEHIVPVASKGGTVLFNCIPTSKEVNGTDQKGAKHLIHWWTSSSYWNQDAPLRLEKIINYMLDGYEQVFKEYTIEEVESSYLDIEIEEGILNEEEDKDINARTESKLLKQAKNNGIHSYLGFIYDCINTLEKCNINTSSIKERLQQLQEQNIFKDIDKYQLYQNIIQKLVVSRIGDNNSSYLTYTLNFDIKKLMDSINLDNEQDIYNELNRRIQNIEQLLKENNLSTVEYFKSLKDIQDIDILYKNNISSEEIKIFLENVKIGLDTKIDIFINMLNEGNDRILKNINSETLKGYPNINLSFFWNGNKNRVKQKLFIELKDNPEYDKARKLITIYEVTVNVENQIPIFIDMLNKGNSNILKRGNSEILEGYPSINLKHFWNHYKDRIKQKLFLELKDNPKYDKARELITIHEVTINVENQIPIFIDMLNKGNNKIIKSGNKEKLVGYPNINLKYFWQNYKDRIKQKLFVELKDNPEYDKARELITINENNIDIEHQIPIFINMLNQGNSNILKRGNKETLEGYPNINLKYFWNHYKNRVKQKLFVELKDDPKYDTARELIMINENNIDIEHQIPIFIDMLNQGNSNILKQGNIQTLKGYPNIKLANLWSNHENKIKQKLFVELKDNSEYNIARQTVLTYYNVSSYEELEFKKTNNLNLRIACFIKMLNKRNKEILKSNNEEYFEGYPNVSVGIFWHRNQNREIIIQTLFNKLKDNPSYDTARRLILDNLKVDTIKEYYEKKQKESKKMEDNKKIKKELEETIKMIDNIYEQLNSEEQRKRA